MRLLIAIAFVVTACSKKADDKCARMIDKSLVVLRETAALRSQQIGDKERDHLVAQCKKDVKAGRKDPQMDCVLAAADDAGVRNCYMKSYEERLARSKEVEAKVQLTKLGKNAKVAYMTNAQFPVGKVGPTPAGPCCGEQVKQCIPTEKLWADPIWQALEFSVEGAFSFQYTYESDGKTFTATATGDVTCAGKPVTHTLTGKVGADGNVELSKL